MAIDFSVFLFFNVLSMGDLDSSSKNDNNSVSPVALPVSSDVVNVAQDVPTVSSGSMQYGEGLSGVDHNLSSLTKPDSNQPPNNEFYQGADVALQDKQLSSSLQTSSVNLETGVFNRQGRKKPFLVATVLTVSAILAVVAGVYSVETQNMNLSRKAASDSFSFSPPPGEKLDLKYSSLEDIPFVVEVIDGFVTNGKRFFEELRQNNPKVEATILKDNLNRELFTYYALKKDFHEDLDFPADYGDLIKANQDLLERYKSESMRFTGYYIKFRYSGYYGKRQEELSEILIGKDVKKYVYDKLSKFIEDNPSIDSLKQSVAADKEIKELNNSGEEPVVFFEDESFEDPPFDDPDFYDYLLSSPVGDYSSIYTLYTKNIYERDKEDYAFLVFYLKNKTGSNAPVNYLIKKTLDGSRYY